MGFWFFLTLCSLLLPLIFLGFGWIFQTHPPKEINSFYGYRTTMSQKNKTTWQFAHAYCGKLWWRLGLLSFPITLLGMLSVCKKDANSIGMMSGTLTLLQTAAICVTIFMTEKALKKNFHKNGLPKKDNLKHNI